MSRRIELEIEIAVVVDELAVEHVEPAVEHASERDVLGPEVDGEERRRVELGWVAVPLAAMTVVAEPAPPAPTAPRRRLAPTWMLVAGAVVVAAGIVLRFVTRSDLWLDEALSVNIARLPFSDLHEALKHDGAPPLYYVLLHLWTDVFGTSDFAVRCPLRA